MSEQDNAEAIKKLSRALKEMRRDEPVPERDIPSIDFKTAMKTSSSMTNTDEFGITKIGQFQPHPDRVNAILSYHKGEDEDDWGDVDEPESMQMGWKNWVLGFAVSFALVFLSWSMFFKPQRSQETKEDDELVEKETKE